MDSISPNTLYFLVMVSGVVGGLVSAAIILVGVRFLGRRVVENLVREQLDEIERRFHSRIVDGALGQIVRALERGEKLGQIAKRVMEIVQISIGHTPPVQSGPPVAPQPMPTTLAPEALAQAQAALGQALIAVGRTTEARRAFEEALRLDPAQAWAAAGLKSIETMVAA